MRHPVGGYQLAQVNVGVPLEPLTSERLRGFVWRLHLYRLAVHPTWRRRGIARQLVAAAEARFAAYGAGRADAMVLDDNPDAHALWSGLGYTPQDTWSRWVRPL